MAERGRRPEGPALQRTRAHARCASLFTPLLPDDYLELINPLWSTQELRGRIERIERETDDAVTIVIKPGLGVAGPRAGPVPAHRRRRRRRPPLARVLADLRPRPPRRLHQHHAQARRGGQGLAVPRPRGASPARSSGSAASRATFMLPDPLPEKLLFISAGSGITPIMSMLRDLDRRERARRRRAPALRAHGRRRHLRRAAARPRRAQRRLPPARAAHRRARAHRRPTTSTSCARTGASARRSSAGPGEMLDAMSEHWERDGDCDRLHMERFQPVVGEGDAEQGEGGTISSSTVRHRGRSPTARSRSSSPARRPARRCPSAAAWASATPASASSAPARSATCAPARSPAHEGEMVRTCINAPEGPVEIAL